MIHSLLSNDMAYAVAWTLVHSIWQIALAAILLKFILRQMHQSTSQARYITAMAALGLCFLMSLITFSSFFIEDSVIVIQQSISVSSGESGLTDAQSASQTGFLQSIENYFPLIINIWLIGTILFMLKIVGAFVYMKSLTNSAQGQSEKLNNILKRLNKKFGINRLLKLKESPKINTPMVIGYMKPVLLFPIGLVNQLSTSEVECIIAHELAHIKRHDFIFNIIQMLAESIYYYHPGLWYISSLINAERENCCDDLAISCCGNNISYARTLVKLQEMKNNINLRPALALSGQSNSFSERILRILNQGSVNTQYREKFMAFGLVFLALICGIGSLNSKAETLIVEAPEIYILDNCELNENSLVKYLDTIPKKQKFHITKMTDSSSVEMKMENGEILELKINGLDIDSKDFDQHEDIILELKPDKNKKIIAVRPDNKHKKMRVEIFDSSKNKMIKVDSIIEDMESAEFEIYFDNLEEDPKFTYKFLIDSLVNQEMSIMKKEFNIDSIMELLPEKMPKIYFHNDDEIVKEKIIVELRESEKAIEDLKLELHRHKAENEFEREIEKHKSIKKDTRKNKDGNNIFEWQSKGKNKQNSFLFEEASPEENIFVHARNQNVSELIMQSLLEDGLIQEEEKTKIELGGKFLKVNGDKQPENIWKKYKNIYEGHTGIEMTKKSKLEFELDPRSHHSEENVFIIKKSK